MSNLGLKPYAKQLEFKTTLGTFFCNLSKMDKNVILDIPLISTPDGMKYPVSLIYNYFNRTTSSSYGNGGLLSLYASFSYRGSSVSQMKGDGASYSYSLSSGKFISEDSGDYVTYDSGTFVLYSSGYSYEYNGNTFHLYNKITSPNGDTLTMTSSSSSEIVYETNYGTKVKIQNSTNSVKLFSYLSDTDTYAYETELTLSNGYLSDVKYYKFETGTNLLMGEYSLSGMDGSPVITDCQKQKNYQVSITDTSISCLETSGSTSRTHYEINYSDSYTNIYDIYGNVTAYYFLNDRLYYVKNPDNLFSGFEYSGNFLVGESEAFIPKRKKEESLISSISQFTNSGLYVGSTTDTDIEELGLMPYRITGSGTLTLNLDEPLSPVTRHSLFTFVRRTSGSVTVSLNYGGTTFMKSSGLNNLMELIYVDALRTSYGSYVTITLTFSGFYGVISLPVLTRDTFGRKYTYTDHYLTKVETKGKEYRYAYDTKGRVTEWKEDKIVHTITYSTISGRSLPTDETIRRNGSVLTKTVKSYSVSDGCVTSVEEVTGVSLKTRKYTSYNESGLSNLSRNGMNAVSNSYNLRNEVSQVNYYSLSDSSVSYYKKLIQYEPFGGINRIENTSGSTDLGTMTYGFDSRNNNTVSTLTKTKVTSLSKGYDSYSEINQISTDGTTLRSYTYNAYGDITQINYPGHDIQYTYDSRGRVINKDGTSVTYSDGLIRTIAGTEEYESCEYDSSLRLIQKGNEEKYVRYSYDTDDNAVFENSKINNTYHYRAYGSDTVSKISYALDYVTTTVFTVYPLNTMTSSLKLDSEPLLFTGTIKERNLLDSSFTYDSSLHRHVYHRAGTTKLVYPTDFTTQGTVTMSLKKGSSTSEETILDLRSDTESFLKLGINSSGCLVVSLYGEALTPTPYLSSGYHRVTLSYSYSQGYQMKLYMDTSSYDISTSSTVTPLTNPKLSVFDTFSGYGEMLGIKPSYYGSVGYFNSAFYIKTIEKLNTFNELGQKVREDILYNTDIISYRTISYKTFTHNQVTYTTDEVENESFHSNQTSLFTLGYSYSYGNISQVTKNNDVIHTYTYSMDSKLLSDESYSYTYDGVGNITSIEGKAIGYSSSQKTKAISYNGSSITYLDNGYFYPVNLDGAALGYGNGKLTSHTKNGTLTTYSYNMYGLRESKTINGVTVQYVYENDRLISLIHPSYTFYFLYDGDEPYGFIYSNNVYYYMKDITGIIRGIVNTNGSIVVEYSYTSYGRIQSVTGSLSSTIGTYNPLRYKSYFYDEESGYYYCKSRYYVPFLGRWLTPDDPKYLDDKSLCGFNPYAYCNDNPVMFTDEEGNFGIFTALLIGAGIGAAIGAGVGIGATAYNDIKDGSWDTHWSTYVGAAVGGAIAGAGTGIATVLGAGIGATAIFGGVGFTLGTVSIGSGAAFGMAVGISAATAGMGYVAKVGIDTNSTWNTGQFFKEIGIGALCGAMSFGTGYVSGFLGYRIPFAGGKIGIKYRAERLLIETALNVPKYLLSLLK